VASTGTGTSNWLRPFTDDIVQPSLSQGVDRDDREIGTEHDHAGTVRWRELVVARRHRNAAADTFGKQGRNPTDERDLVVVEPGRRVGAVEAEHPPTMPP